jgi:hypothetical protein
MVKAAPTGTATSAADARSSAAAAPPFCLETMTASPLGFAIGKSAKEGGEKTQQEQAEKEKSA